MRYFVELLYRGTNYFGWQIQPHQISVQEQLQNAFSTLLRTEVLLTGCGRTDTGVHALQYFAHFDYPEILPGGFIGKLNRFLPSDIVIKRIFEVASEAHARFDAISRSYTYYISLEKDPFSTETAWYFPFTTQLDIQLLQDAARILMDFNEFFPFCKTGSDVRNRICSLSESCWKIQDNKMEYHISANRFLRGMVRLIVGMCLNVSTGKLSLDEVNSALKSQTYLSKNDSVPAHGLFLTNIVYPYTL